MEAVFAKICVFTTIAIFLQGSVASNSLLSLTSTQLIDDEEHDKYVVYNLLEKALINSSFNLYKLRNTFYSGELVLCLPVSYELECINDTMSGSNNCTFSVYTVSFLWTMFDTNTTAGKSLLFFTKNQLKSPLFYIRHKFCSFSLETCGIKLYLQIPSFPEFKSNTSADSIIDDSLNIITKKLMEYAQANGMPTGDSTTDLDGYALIWDINKEHKFSRETNISDTVIPAILMPIAYIIGIGSGSKLLHSTRRTVYKKDTPEYYAFWSFQILALLVNGFYTVYTPIKSPHPYIYVPIILVVVMTLIYSVIVVVCTQPASVKEDAQPGTPDRRRGRATEAPKIQLQEEQDTEEAAQATDTTRDTHSQEEDTVEKESTKDEQVQGKANAPTQTCTLEEEAARATDTEISTRDAHSRVEDTVIQIEKEPTEDERVQGKANASTLTCTLDAQTQVTEENLQKQNLKIPFISSDHEKPLIIIFATANTFIFFIYMAYTLPWVILGFYIYPVRILVRISFVLTAGLAIILHFSLILKYSELSVEIYTMSLRERQQYELINKADAKVLKWELFLKKYCGPTGKCCCKLLLSMLTPCATFLVLLFWGYTGYLLYCIIFLLTDEVNEASEELLQIVPLIILSLSTYFIGNLFTKENVQNYLRVVDTRFTKQVLHHKLH